MALIRTITTSPNQATKVFTLGESTGVYNSTTNPGGYGASQVPTGTREVTDIISGNIFILTKDGTIEVEGATILTVTEDIYSEILDDTAAQLLSGGTDKDIDLSSLEDYSDGVYQVAYINWFEGTSTINGEDISIISVADINEFVNSTYISIDVENNGTFLIYEILNINTTNNTITINSTITTDGEVDYRVGYSVIGYFANVCDINRCLYSDVAKIACSECGCNKTKKEKLFISVMDFLGIETNMGRGNYNCAQELIDSITIYCSKSGCGC